MAEIFDTLLLLALPASGKSEVRNYLTHKNPEQFHMGPTAQLDDYPYVHLQVRIDEELEKLGQPRVFHADATGPFRDPRDYAGLIELLNEDYHEFRTGRPEVIPEGDSAARRLFERLDAAFVRAGGEERLTKLPADVMSQVAEAIDQEAAEMFAEKAANCPESLDGTTIVIEFARGGPLGQMPLPEFYGYLGSLSCASPELLERAAILYVWVTPEESRRKNRARARPGEQGSILFHGTPEPVMLQEYACDDMELLIGKARKADTIPIDSHGRSFDIPMARFDNREDKTSFLREDADKWSKEDIDRIHGGLKEASDRLWKAFKA